MQATISSDVYTAVEFPAIVENDKKALETLGGVANISKALSIPGARMHLNFRPDMHFSRAAIGDSQPTQALAMRVRRIRNRDTGEERLIVSNVHVVGTVFRFNGMCDYQFDPFRRVPGGEGYEVFYRDIVPQRPSLAVREWLNRSDVPLYLPPTVFARQDTPGRYDYAPKFKTESRIQEEIRTDEKEQIRVSMLCTGAREFQYSPKSARKMRKSRKNNAISIYYDQEVPDGPQREAMDRLVSNELRSCYEAMLVLFRERPVWPKSAIVHKLSNNYSLNAIRFVLPCVAYYCLSGPWARLWIRFGYNPKADKSSKMYQTVDFRIVPRFTGEELMVPPRRRTQERADPIPRGPTNVRAVPEDSPSKDQLDEYSYVFRPHTLPTARQINYMLCDIEEEQVQAIVHANDGQEPAECDPNDGWCVRHYALKVREILSSYTDKALGRRRPPTHVHPQGTRLRHPATAPRPPSDEGEEEEETPGTTGHGTVAPGASEVNAIQEPADTPTESNPLSAHGKTISNE